MKKYAWISFILLVCMSFNTFCADVYLEVPSSVTSGSTYWVSLLISSPTHYPDFAAIGRDIFSNAAWTGNYEIDPAVIGKVEIEYFGDQSPDIPYDIWGIYPVSLILPPINSYVKFEVLCIDQGDVLFSLFDAEVNLVDTKVVHQVPEPATLLLLTVGGLALLRKRK